MVPPGAVKRSATRLSSFHFPPSTFPLSSTTVFSPPRASLSNRLSAGPDFRPYNTLISPPSVILHSSAAVVFSYLYVRSPSCCDTPLCRGSAEPGLELLSIFQPQEVFFPFYFFAGSFRACLLPIYLNSKYPRCPTQTKSGSRRPGLSRPFPLPF